MWVPGEGNKFIKFPPGKYKNELIDPGGGVGREWRAILRTVTDWGQLHISVN